MINIMPPKIVKTVVISIRPFLTARNSHVKQNKLVGRVSEHGQKGFAQQRHEMSIEGRPKITKFGTHIARSE